MGLRGTGRVVLVVRLVVLVARLVVLVVRLAAGPVALVLRRVARRASALPALAADSGAAVAEYAITTLAAIGFAGVLLRLLTGANAAHVLEELILGALRKFL